MNEPDVVSVLSTSFAKQLGWYRELSQLVHKTIGKLVLTRDISQVMENFAQKQKILDLIVAERGAMSGFLETWRQTKNKTSGDARTAGLNAVLDTTAAEISEFLEAEGQLKRLLEHYKKTGIDG
jgi:hypothetical protein